MPVVAAIEALQHPVPWSSASFMDALRNGRTWHSRVLKDEMRHVLGYYIAMTAGDDEDLLTITVRPEFAGQGLGRHLLQDLLVNARQRGAARVFLEVRESNSRAIRLYTQMGFRISGMRKNYYPVPADLQTGLPAGREHAVLMCLLLSEACV